LNLVRGLLGRIAQIEVAYDNKEEVATLFTEVFRAAARNFDNSGGYRIAWDWVSSSSQCIPRIKNTYLV